MGIRKLGSALRPYASDCFLDGEDVVMDGPAMAFHIFGVWSQMNQAVRSILDLPDSKRLGNATVDWLDQLVGHRIRITKIYFDGYLPPSKQPVRIERLTKNTVVWSNYYWAHSTRVPSPSPPPEHDSLLGHISGPVARCPAHMPPPPFFVPSIIETLLSLPRYASLVELVPGEADAYCAGFAAASCSPCTIITSDSDLLVHRPLGEDTGVVFLCDIHVDATRTKPVIRALKFYPTHIEERLGISHHGGICRLAHQMSRDKSSTLRQHLQRMKSSDTPAPGYAEFQSEYRIFDHGMQTHFPGKLVRNLNLLDPRVSEFFLRCTVPGSLTGDYHPDFVPMYLPGVLDCPVRTSAWHSSENVRRLAYGLDSAPFNTGRKTVVEYRRVQSPSSGKLINIPPAPVVQCITEELLAIFAVLSPTSETNMGSLWSLFCIYLDCTVALSQEKIPLSCALLKKTGTPGISLDITSWDLVHFAAQHEAVLYSLRLLKQVLDILLASGCEPSERCIELRGRLEGLPPLRAIDSPAQLARSMSNWSVVDIFSCLSKVLGKHDAFTLSSLKPSSGTGGKRKEKRKVNTQDSVPGKLLTGNPFASLDPNAVL